MKGATGFEVTAAFADGDAIADQLNDICPRQNVVDKFPRNLSAHLRSHLID